MSIAEVLILILAAIVLLALVGTVAGFLARVVVAIVALAVPVILILDITQGGPLLEQIIRFLGALFIVMYAGLLALSRRLQQ